MNTILKTTQWERPTQRVSSSGGGGGDVHMVDAPRVHTRRQSAGTSGGATAIPAPSYSSVFGRGGNSRASTTFSGTRRAAFNPLWPRIHPAAHGQPVVGRRPASTDRPESTGHTSATSAVAGGGGAAAYVLDPTSRGRAAGSGDASLPPNWQTRFTSEGKLCEYLSCLIFFALLLLLF